MKKLILQCLLLMCFFTSCSIATFYPENKSQARSNVSSKDVRIYTSDIDKPYTVIGSIAVDVLGNGDDALRYIKMKAARQGADAIIHADLTKIHSSAARTGISGVAVKLQ